MLAAIVPRRQEFLFMQPFLHFSRPNCSFTLRLGLRGLLLPILILLCFSGAQPTRAQYLENLHLRQKINKVCHIDLSNAQMVTLRQSKYQGVAWPQVIEGMTATQELVDETQQSKTSLIVDWAINYGKDNAIDEVLEKLGLSTLSKAIAVVGAARQVNEAVQWFVSAADKQMLQIQMDRYFQARQADFTQEGIESKQEKSITGGTVIYDDNGWILSVNDKNTTVSPHPGHMKPAQAWFICERVWDLKQDPGSFDQEKQKIGQAIQQAVQKKEVKTVTPSVTQRLIKRIYFIPVPCKYKKCEGQKYHGNLHVVYDDGSDVQATKAGDVGGDINVRGDSVDDALPKIAHDRRTVGWCLVKHVTHVPGSPNEFTELYATKLVLWRDGKVVRVVNGVMAFVQEWFFLDGDKRVAVKSRNGHGPATDELHDVSTGRLLQQLPGYQSDKGPSWAKQLGE